MKCRRGLGLIELLVSLAITASLLTAAAAALMASAQAVSNNDEFFRSTQAARVTMNLILAEVRRCRSVVGVDSTGLQVITSDGRDLTWFYAPPTESQTGRITLTDASTGVAHVLARNISSAHFGGVMGVNANNAPSVTKVNVEMTAEIRDSSVTLSGSVAPRVNMTY